LFVDDLLQDFYLIYLINVASALASCCWLLCLLVCFSVFGLFFSACRSAGPALANLAPSPPSALSPLSPSFTLLHSPLPLSFILYQFVMGFRMVKYHYLIVVEETIARLV
jgi:hypothetical protein